MGSRYHPEIDGLRAIAVSAVLLYHVDAGVKAGFVGVDIFFVISGYLITDLILRERQATGKLGFAAFYARRARRILPAAVLVLLSVLALAAMVPPAERLAIQQSAVASALFAANLHFQSATSGYFVGDSSQIPLLHLWSLAVEEQFYVFWPLLLAAVPVRNARLAMAAIAAVSLAWAEWLVRTDPTAAFFLTPARAWEMAAGGLVAATPARSVPGWLLPASLATLFAACLLPPSTFPGIGALPAVVGTAGALWAVHCGASNPLLRSRPVVGIGLISYSLYLWHWPLLSFDRLFRAGTAPASTRVGLLAVAVLLAWLTYRFVETPFRRAARPAKRTLLAGFAAAASCSALAWAWQAPVGPPRTDIRSSFERECFPYVEGQPVRVQRPACAGVESKVVIWGDSYAHSWQPLAEAIASDLRIPAVSWALDACPPLPGLKTGSNSAMLRTCEAWNRSAMEWIRSHGAHTLIIASRWERSITDHTEGLRSLSGAIERVSPGVQRILVIAPTPVLPDTPEKCRALALDCSVSRQAYDSGAGAPAWQALRALDQPKVQIVDAASWLCEGDVCSPFRGDMPLYSGDGAHVSAAAAHAFAVDNRDRWARATIGQDG